MTTTYIKDSEGNYVCPHCGDVKRNRSTMFYHIKKHTGTLNYICPEPDCGAAFLQKSGLTQHYRYAHKEKKDKDAKPNSGNGSGNGSGNESLWGCPECKYTCATKSNVVIHIGRKHGAPIIPPVTKTECGNIECSGCSKLCASSTAYFYHAVSCFSLKLEPKEVSTKETLTIQNETETKTFDNISTTTE